VNVAGRLDFEHSRLKVRVHMIG